MDHPKALPKTLVLSKDDDAFLRWVGDTCPRVSQKVTCDHVDDLRRVVGEIYHPDISLIYQQPFVQDFGLIDSHTPNQQFSQFLSDTSASFNAACKAKHMFALPEKHFVGLIENKDGAFCVASFFSILYTKKQLEGSDVPYVRKMAEAHDLSPEPETNRFEFGSTIHFDPKVSITALGVTDTVIGALNTRNADQILSIKECIARKKTRFLLISWGLLIPKNQEFSVAGADIKSTGHAITLIVDISKKIIYIMDPSYVDKPSYLKFTDLVFKRTIKAVFENDIGVKFIIMDQKDYGEYSQCLQGDTDLCSAWAVYLVIIFMLNWKKTTYADIYSKMMSYSQKERDRFIMRFLFWVHIKKKGMVFPTPVRKMILPEVKDLF